VLHLIGIEERTGGSDRTDRFVQNLSFVKQIVLIIIEEICAACQMFFWNETSTRLYNHNDWICANMIVIWNRAPPSPLLVAAPPILCHRSIIGRNV